MGSCRRLSKQVDEDSGGQFSTLVCVGPAYADKFSATVAHLVYLIFPAELAARICYELPQV